MILPEIDPITLQEIINTEIELRRMEAKQRRLEKDDSKYKSLLYKIIAKKISSSRRPVLASFLASLNERDIKRIINQAKEHPE